MLSNQRNVLSTITQVRPAIKAYFYFVTLLRCPWCWNHCGGAKENLTGVAASSPLSPTIQWERIWLYGVNEKQSTGIIWIQQKRTSFPLMCRISLQYCSCLATTFSQFLWAVSQHGWEVKEDAVLCHHRCLWSSKK